MIIYSNNRHQVAAGVKLPIHAHFLVVLGDFDQERPT